MKCILCDQRKAKRFCPAKETLICAQCCGEKRVLEIDCPDSCEYLKTGRTHEVRQETLRHFRTSDPAQNQKYQRVFAEFQDFLGALEYVIAEERRASKDLKDKDVSDALDLVLDTLRTEDRGVLYERTSNDLRVEMLRKQITAVVASHRTAHDQKASAGDLVPPGARVLRLRDAIDSLEVIRGIVASHMSSGASSKTYVDFLARLLPRKKVLHGTGPSIIIPGR